jgi:hypothetical protein
MGEEKKKFYKKKKGKVHISKELDSDYSSSFDDEGLVASAFNKSSLLPQRVSYVPHGQGEEGIYT